MLEKQLFVTIFTWEASTDDHWGKLGTFDIFWVGMGSEGIEFGSSWNVVYELLHEIQYGRLLFSEVDGSGGLKGDFKWKDWLFLVSFLVKPKIEYYRISINTDIAAIFNKKILI